MIFLLLIFFKIAFTDIHTHEDDEVCTYRVNDYEGFDDFPGRIDFKTSWLIFPSGLIDYSLEYPKFEGGVSFPTKEKSEMTLVDTDVFKKNFRNLSMALPDDFDECLDENNEFDFDSKCWEIEEDDTNFPKYLRTKNVENCRFNFHYRDTIEPNLSIENKTIEQVKTQKEEILYVGYYQPFSGQLTGKFYDLKFNERITRNFAIFQYGSFDLFLAVNLVQGENGFCFEIKTKYPAKDFSIVSEEYDLTNITITDTENTTNKLCVFSHNTSSYEGMMEISFSFNSDESTTEVHEELEFRWISQGHSFSTPFSSLMFNNRRHKRNNHESFADSVSFVNNRLLINVKLRVPIFPKEITIKNQRVDSFSIETSDDEEMTWKNHHQHGDIYCPKCEKVYTTSLKTTSMYMSVDFDSQSYGEYLIHYGLTIEIVPPDSSDTKDTVEINIDGNYNVKYSPYSVEEDRQQVWPYYIAVGAIGSFGVCVTPGVCILVPGVVFTLKAIWKRNMMKMKGERVSTSSESDGEVYPIGRKRSSGERSSEQEFRGDSLTSQSESELEEFENDNAEISLRVPLNTGKYAIGKDGKYYHVLDLSFKYINKQILAAKSGKFSSKKNIIQVLNGLKASKYIAYSHCKYCFVEQKEFEKKWKERMKTGYESDYDDDEEETMNLANCCKCGFPLIPYVEFKKTEMFCIICATLNKYDTKNHGRCLLHVSSRKSSKNAGCVYYLYKEVYSVATAARKKKKCESSDRLATFLEKDNWSLNCVMRFEYLSLCKYILGRELFVPLAQREDIRSLRYTLKLFEERKISIIPQKKFEYEVYNLKVDLDQIPKKKADEFKNRFKMLIDKTIVTIKKHLQLYDSLVRTTKVKLKKRNRDDGEIYKANTDNNKVRKLVVEEENDLNKFSPNSNCSTDTTTTIESEKSIDSHRGITNEFFSSSYLGMIPGILPGMTPTDFNMSEQMKDTFIDELLIDEDSWETINFGITAENGGLNFEQGNQVLFNDQFFGNGQVNQINQLNQINPLNQYNFYDQNM